MTHTTQPQWQLGIDLGTASIGFAAYSLEQGEFDTLIDHGIRLFDEPVDSGKAGLESKAAARRGARQQRRQIHRRALRKRDLWRLAPLLGLEQGGVAPVENLPELRARAARERVGLDDLLRIFNRLSRRRGYRGSFGENRKGEVADGARGLGGEMQRVALETGRGDITLGEYLHWRQQHGQPIRLKVRDKNPMKPDGAPLNLYALRKQVEDEFDRIWEVQSEHHDLEGVWQLQSQRHPELMADFGGRYRRTFSSCREVFHHAIFFQRPLKSVATMVGMCSLEPHHHRAPRAQLAFQRFRIEKTIADLRWGMGSRAEVLTAQQKEVIRRELDDCKEKSFEAIYKALAKAGCPKQEGKGLNLERASREVLPGNKTNDVWKKMGLLEAWRALADGEQIAVINLLADLGSPEQLEDSEWHQRFLKKDGKPRQFTPAVIGFITKLVAHEKYDRLATMGFDGGRASYSVKALNRLTDWLKEAPTDPGEKRDEEAAINACYDQRNKSPEQATSLAPPPVTGNAVVDKALRQLAREMNHLIKRCGRMPSAIVIEMARDVGLGISARNERESDINKNQKSRRAVVQEIERLGHKVTPSRIRRYLLWQEQNNQCPYCGHRIECSDAMSGATHYEHMIPRNLTQSGMKRSEIVLAHAECNDRKGDRTPMQAVADGIFQREVIEACAEALEKKKLFRKAKILRLEDYEAEVLTDQSIADFTDRQIHATSWIAKEVLQWMAPLCPGKVSVSRGEFTALLRKRWKLDTVIPEVRIEEGLPLFDEDGKPLSADDFRLLKPLLENHDNDRDLFKRLKAEHPQLDLSRRPDKRIDNRHHLIDALVIGLTSRSMFQWMAQEYRRLSELPRSRQDSESLEDYEYRMRRSIRKHLPLPRLPIPNLRELALEAVRNPHISRKTDRYTDGRIFEDTAYSRSREERTKDGDHYLVKRKEVAQFGGTKPTPESVKKDIASIESDEIRRIVEQAFEERIAQGQDAKEAIKTPILHPVFQKPIKNIRCTGDSAAEAIRIQHGRDKNLWKYLVPDGCAYVDVWPNGKKAGVDFVRPHQAMRSKTNAIPAGGKRIFKGDVYWDEKEKMAVRVVRINPSQGSPIVVLPLVEPRSFDKTNAKELSKSDKTGYMISMNEVLKRFTPYNPRG